MVTAYTLESNQEAILMERSDNPPLSKGGLEGLSKCKQLNSPAITLHKKSRYTMVTAYTLEQIKRLF